MKHIKWILLLSAFWLTGEKSSAQETDSAMRYQEIKTDKNKPLQAEAKNYKIWFDARVQTDGSYFTGKPLNPTGNGVSVKQIRLSVKSQFAAKWYGELGFDVANAEIALKDAYLKFSPNKYLGIKIGNFKEGFSMERTTTSKYLPFIEIPNAIAAFTPSRRIGLAITYSRNWMFTTGGIHFQDIGSSEKRHISNNNNKEYGMDEGISFTGKLVAMPFYNDSGKGLHIGLAGSYRTPKTDTEIRDSEEYSTRSLSSINRKKYLNTGVIPLVDHTVLTNFELAGYYKNFKFQSEYTLSNVHRKNDLPVEKFDGWYAFGSVLLFGGHYNYSTAKGEFTQPSRGKGRGDLELLFRYDYLNLNSAPDGIMGGAGEGYTLGANYHVNSNVRIMLNYSYVNHDRHANGNGKLFVGYDEAGELTKDSQKVVNEQGKAGDDFGIVNIRFEVIF